MSLWRRLSKLNIHAKYLNRNGSYKKVTTNPLNIPKFTILELSKNGFHTSSTNKDLMEFFDDPVNWSKTEVHVGRSWKQEELRIKSNSDLHKLWYVLLKEKNMLLTMEHELNRLGKSLPNPERLDKVKESMENLETIVRERNRAYFELETGETGERPVGINTNCFGLEYKYKMNQYPIEKRFNKKYLINKCLNDHTTDHVYVRNFLAKLQEKRRKIEIFQKRRRYITACKLMQIFPHLDEEALKEKFPDVDIEAVKKDKRSRAHQENAH